MMYNIFGNVQFWSNLTIFRVKKIVFFFVCAISYSFLKTTILNFISLRQTHCSVVNCTVVWHSALYSCVVCSTVL